ncbi:uncharacterized protein DEA37_0011916, partial [Paragonimus westermani]
DWSSVPNIQFDPDPSPSSIADDSKDVSPGDTPFWIQRNAVPHITFLLNVFGFSTFLHLASATFSTTIPMNFLVDCVLAVHCFCTDFMANMRLFHLSFVTLFCAEDECLLFVCPFRWGDRVAHICGFLLSARCHSVSNAYVLMHIVRLHHNRFESTRP